MTSITPPSAIPPHRSPDVDKQSKRRQKHAVVIGSGFGGLAAAIRLGARGYRVTVLEKCDSPGGRARVFRQDGFSFDAGPTIITAPFLFDELWEMCGRKLADDVDLRAVSPFYRIRFEDGRTFNYTGDAEAMRQEVAKFEPEDVAGYNRFLQTSREACRIGFEERGHVSFARWQTMAIMVPEMLGANAHRSVASVVASHFRSEQLRTVFSFHPLLIGGNPFSVSAIYCLVAYLERQWGVHFAMGGTYSLVSGLIDLIEGQGSEVRLNAEVSEILVENGNATGVRLASGAHLHADIVVSNADSAWTYRHLIAPKHRKRWTDRRIAKAKYSMSLFVWYFGTNRQYPDVAHHTILLGERYKALLTDIFKKHKLADDFSLYLHRPTATDPSLAPEGCDSFYVLSPVPHLDSGTDWAVRAESYRQSIAAYLSATVLPGLEDAVVSSKVMTPQDFHDELLAYKGAAFSLEPVISQTAYFRPHNKSEEIGNLFLVGAGTHPGAGVPGVLSSARVLDEVVPHADALV
jgi:phytoene desaturase